MKITILGAGHMGSWIAKELSTDHEISILDILKERALKFKDAVPLKNYSDLKNFDPEMIINAVNLKNTYEAFESAFPFISKKCIIVDLASVKGGLPLFYKKNSFPFVSIHPMFGPTFANVSDLEKENAVIIKESDSQGALFFNKLFKKMRLNISEFSFKEHDQMIAYSLTLPFASTIVFAACMKNKIVPGSTFKKHFEIAKGLFSEDDNLISEILFNSFSLPQLEKVSNQLEFLKHIIREKDSEEAKKYISLLRKNITIDDNSNLNTMKDL